ncbi:YIP1 family protein [Roseovarius sp. SCSIO 43702]|uniref:Yip1 family protein n=1 Tax=Roseovarius sp. SCSIO 43702 TaxID=2823043 RepID=UPI001C734725|nr:Yip1 family protein [Roseovarius sp. SCSIO 43702]QYX55447.1 YIP1 family protein [Roseovarius sp. SCSIO 43702]
MTASGLLKDLLRQTLTDPREAGRRIIAMGWPAQVLWLTLSLIAVVMSLLMSALLQAAPLPDDPMGDMLRLSPAYYSPLLFAALQWVQAIVSVFALTVVGRAFGGTARVEDMLAVTIWLQIVALILGLGVIVVGVILPPLGAFAILAYLAWALFITLALIDAAHGFDNIFKALGVLVATIIALTLISAILAGLLGITATGT